MEYKIKNECLEVIISTLGAEMISVKYKNEERLWQNENNTWKGHAPVLFPIAGKIGVVIDGYTYPLKQHGFARNNEFELLDIVNDKAQFILRSDGRFKELYPFEFNLIIEYTLVKNSIILSYIVKNIGDKTMYYSIGGHTSFSLDSTIDNYCLVMKDDQEINTLMLENGLFNNVKNQITSDGIIDLSSKYLDNSETIIIKNPLSKKVSLIKKDGSKIVDVEYINLNHLLLWHPIKSKMICIEPWNNLLDYNHEKIEFKDKEYIRKLKEKESETFKQIYTYY